MDAKRSIVTIVLAVTLLVSMTGMASANSITWDLDSENLATDVYEMERCYGSGDDGQTGNVTIGPESNVTWRADEAAQCNYTFDGCLWDITLYRSSNVSTHNVTVEIGIWNGTIFTDKGSNNATFTNSERINVDVDVPEFTVPNGEYVAIRVNNTETSSLTMETKENSHVTYPGAPGYPVPELTTFALVGIGLIGLVALRRRKG